MGGSREHLHPIEYIQNFHQANDSKVGLVRKHSFVPASGNESQLQPQPMNPIFSKGPMGRQVSADWGVGKPQVETDQLCDVL